MIMVGGELEVLSGVKLLKYCKTTYARYSNCLVNALK